MEVGEWCRGGCRGSCRPGLLSEPGAGGTADAGCCSCARRGLGGFERLRAGGCETFPLPLESVARGRVQEPRWREKASRISGDLHMGRKASEHPASSTLHSICLESKSIMHHFLRAFSPSANYWGVCVGGGLTSWSKMLPSVA